MVCLLESRLQADSGPHAAAWRRAGLRHRAAQCGSITVAERMSFSGGRADTNLLIVLVLTNHTESSAPVRHIDTDRRRRGDRIRATSTTGSQGERPVRV